METKDYLTNYYERYDEDGRLTSKHGIVEYITTMKYIEKYLQPGMKILEIGAATGRYSHALAQKGYLLLDFKYKVNNFFHQFIYLTVNKSYRSIF